jgi:hypothetical protein
MENPSSISTLCGDKTPFNVSIKIQHFDYSKPKSAPIWTLHDIGERYSTLVELHNTNDIYQMNIECEGTGMFTFDSNSIQVNWQPQGTGFEHYLQSLGLSYWLEKQGIPCIHANAVSFNDQAYLIIAPSRTGKSTLTTELLNHGFQLMTDDMAAIHPTTKNEYTIYPSWPKVRLWPDTLESAEKTWAKTTLDAAKPQITNSKVHQKFAKAEIDLCQVSDNIWQQTPCSLKAIYYLDRQEHTNHICKITQLHASQSLMLLLQNSILANAYTSMGVEQKRLAYLAEMLTHIPLFKMTYKSGLDNLSDVNAELKEHANELH